MRAFAIVILFFLLGCSSAPVENKFRNPAQEKTFSDQKYEIILDHTYFQISYDKDHRLAKWVQYNLTRGDLVKQIGKRSNKFRPDPLLKKWNIPGVKKDEIPGALYDRGHMAPANDFTRSQAAVDETFVTSNIAPQKSTLNQVAWLRLESLVQKWACGESEITVITGPVLRDDLPKLPNGMSIPDKFYKAIYTNSKGLKSPLGKSICFIYSQDDKSVEPKDRAMSVSECEKTVGFDLGPRDLQFTENDYNFNEWRAAKCGMQ